MSNDLKDILGESNKDIDNQALMDYLNRQLNPAHRHELEKQMAGDPFMDDAMEGLEQIADTKNIDAYVEQLNRDLHKQLDKKKKRREKRRFKDYPWVYFAIVLLLLLCMVAYFVVRRYMDTRNKGEGEGSATIKTHATLQRHIDRH
jgi:anti-sigma factor RsiW